MSSVEVRTKTERSVASSCVRSHRFNRSLKYSMASEPVLKLSGLPFIPAGDPREIAGDPGDAFDVGRLAVRAGFPQAPDDLAAVVAGSELGRKSDLAVLGLAEGLDDEIGDGFRDWVAILPARHGSARRHRSAGWKSPSCLTRSIGIHRMGNIEVSGIGIVDLPGRLVALHHPFGKLRENARGPAWQNGKRSIRPGSAPGQNAYCSSLESSSHFSFMKEMTLSPSLRAASLFVQLFPGVGLHQLVQAQDPHQVADPPHPQVGLAVALHGQHGKRALRRRRPGSRQ